MAENNTSNHKIRETKSAPFKLDKRFVPTKTGLIGNQRETMLQSELQFLPQLGKTKTRGHKLPPDSFIYGITYEKTDGGVPEALQHWVNLAKDSKAREERYKLVRDFMALNKEAVKSGCVNTKQNDQFRALHDIKRKVKIGGGFDSSSDNNYMNRNKVSFPDEMIFGMPHRPSTPINEVLEYRYLHDWLDHMQTQEAERVNARREATKAISGAYHTKSSWLKNSKIPVDKRPLWKMTKFKDVEAAIDSFRTDIARQKAYSVADIDSATRLGETSLKQGVFNVTNTTLPS